MACKWSMKPAPTYSANKSDLTWYKPVYVQGTSVYMSTFTLTAIAIDRWPIAHLHLILDL